jgi:hypothetical protein
VWPQEPDADPLRQFLGSLDRFRGLPTDTLVLPSHDWPFRGLHGRLDDLTGHHRERLVETEELCEAPATGVDVLCGLFTRELDDHQLFFAIGESLAHLHYLAADGRIERRVGGEGVYRFQRVEMACCSWPSTERLPAVKFCSIGFKSMNTPISADNLYANDVCFPLKGPSKCS